MLLNGLDEGVLVDAVEKLAAGALETDAARCHAPTLTRDPHRGPGENVALLMRPVHENREHRVLVTSAVTAHAGND